MYIERLFQWNGYTNVKKKRINVQRENNNNDIEKKKSAKKKDYRYATFMGLIEVKK